MRYNANRTDASYPVHVPACVSNFFLHAGRLLYKSADVTRRLQELLHECLGEYEKARLSGARRRRVSAETCDSFARGMVLDLRYECRAVSSCVGFVFVVARLKRGYKVWDFFLSILSFLLGIHNASFLFVTADDLHARAITPVPAAAATLLGEDNPVFPIVRSTPVSPSISIPTALTHFYCPVL